MNTRSFTILETVLATILATLLIIGTAAVFQNMQNQTSAFKTSVDKDMRWVEANRHLVESVHASSFLNILPDPTRPNQSTLELHNYGGDKKGTYTNDNTGLSYQDATSGAITTFPGVNATFTAPSTGSTTGKGWKNNKLIEAIINYSAPFTSTLRLRCAVNTRVTNGGMAIVIGGIFADDAQDIKQTSDGGYIITGTANGTTDIINNCVYVIKLKLTSKGLEKEWSKVFISSSDYYTGGGHFVIETFDVNGISNGYIIAGTGSTVASGNNMCLIRLDAYGNLRWQRYFNAPAGANTSGVCVRQTFNKRTSGAPSGYIITGGGAYGSKAGMMLWRISESASLTSADCTWVKAFTYTGALNSSGYDVNQLFDSSGNPDGYLLSGTSCYSAYIVKTDDLGAPKWSNIYKKGSIGNYTYKAFYANRLYTSAGVPNGYIIGGHNYGFCVFVLKLDDDASGRARSWVYYPMSQTNNTYFNTIWKGLSGNIVLSAYSEPAPAQASPGVSYLTNINQSNGSASSPQFFPYLTHWAAPELESYKSGVFDGYLLTGTWTTSASDNIQGLRGNNIYILKTDINGNCADANNPIFIPDTLDQTTMSYTSFSSVPAVSWYDTSSGPNSSTVEDLP